MSPRRNKTTDLFNIPIRATPLGVFLLFKDLIDIGTQKPIIHMNL